MNNINISAYLENINEKFRSWSESHYFKIALFNVILVLLLLLRSAGYFEPYFLLTINLIIFISMLLSIVLLSANSKSMFIISLIFWIFTWFLRITQIEVWAERAALYSYQALVIGMVLLIFENKQLNFLTKILKKK